MFNAEKRESLGDNVMFMTLRIDLQLVSMGDTHFCGRGHLQVSPFFCVKHWKAGDKVGSRSTMHASASHTHIRIDILKFCTCVWFAFTDIFGERPIVSADHRTFQWTELKSPAEAKRAKTSSIASYHMHFKYSILEYYTSFRLHSSLACFIIMGTASLVRVWQLVGVPIITHIPAPTLLIYDAFVTFSTWCYLPGSFSCSVEKLWVAWGWG